MVTKPQVTFFSNINKENQDWIIYELICLHQVSFRNVFYIMKCMCFV